MITKKNNNNNDKEKKKKKENEMMTKILTNEIRNIEQKQEIEKRQKEERKVKVRVGEKLEQIVQLVQSLAQKARVFFGRLQCSWRITITK